MTNFISQARTMETHGMPNDVSININTLAVICLVPLLEHVIYPCLRAKQLAMGHVSRIALGFGFLGLAMAYTAVVQHLIYASPPCFDKPLARDCLDGRVPNRIHVGFQAPSYLLVAVAEILAVPTGYEYAFSRAPANMKSIIMALFLSTVAVGALLAMVVNQLAVDPLLTWMYMGLSAVSFLAGILLWALALYPKRAGRETSALTNETLAESSALSEASPLLPSLPIPRVDHRSGSS